MTPVEFEYSGEFRIENADQLRGILATQVVTPCGRYGISLPMDYGIGKDQLSITLPVFDFFLRKVSHYRYEARAYNQCDFIYCLNSTTLVSIRAKSRGFVQKVWILNHKEKTVEVESIRNYKHKIENAQSLTIHERCKKEFAIELKGKSYNIWISSQPHELDHHLIFLIPRNPNSKESLKLFYANLNRLPNSMHEIVIDYNLARDGSACIAPNVIGNSIRFPVSIRTKQIFGLWMTLNVEKLENRIDTVETDIRDLGARQGKAYAYAEHRINSESEVIQEQHPALESTFYAGPTHSVCMEKRKDGLASRLVLLMNLDNGKAQSFRESMFWHDTFSVHPSGRLVYWLQQPTGLKAFGYDIRSFGVPALFKLVQKKLFMQDSIEIRSIPGFDRIFFN